MGLLSWFRRPPPPSDAAVLASLAARITDSRAALAALRLRERRATLLLTLYGLAAWALYLALWLAHALVPHSVLGAVPVFLGPVL